MTMHRQMHQLPLAKTCCRLSSVAMSSGFVKQCHQTMEEGFAANDLNHAEDKCVFKMTFYAFPPNHATEDTHSASEEVVASR